MGGDRPSAAREGQDGPLEAARHRMVRTQIEARGVRDARVLAALRDVPRHRFVPEELADRAYDDGPLAIGSGQTISQPFIVGAMTAALAPKPGDRVLEVGTGCGYQAAVLSRVVGEVVTIERIASLADRARERLARLGYANIEVRTGDGFHGAPDRAPFDGILVTAAPETVPAPLLEQLGMGGRLVIPVGRSEQDLRLLERTPDGIQERSLFAVRFVPFLREVTGS